MLRDFSVSSLERKAGVVAVLALFFLVLLLGRPHFTNASKPPRGIADPAIALQMVQNVEEVDDILSDAPSPDREVMRFKQWIDFGFIVSYFGLFAIIGVLFSRSGGWARSAGMALLVCALGAAIFDAIENIAILRLIDVPLRETTPALVMAIRRASAAKWVLAALTGALLAAFFLRSTRWTHRAIGVLAALSAVLELLGLYDNVVLPLAAIPILLGIAAIAVLYFRPHTFRRHTMLRM